jgi:hypothetical protein
VTATIVVETSLFVVGLLLYLRATEPRNRTGIYSLWSLVVFLLAIYAGNLFGPPPPGPHAIAIAGLAMWLLVVWGYWIDRNRRLVRT